MERYTHVHCVCDGPEPEYTSGRKDLFWGPGWGGGGGRGTFPVLLKGEQKIFIAAYGNRYFISTYVQFQEPPLVVINDTSRSTMTQNQI